VKTASIVIITISAVSFTSCDRSTDSKIVGTWRWEDEHNVEELTLTPDHSFRSLTTYKQILATPSVAIEVGSWQQQANELRFDATLTFDKTKRQIKRTVSSVTEDSFTMMNFADHKIVTYHRFQMPLCNGVPIVEATAVRDSDLLGSWELHYNTHDYKFNLLPNGRLEMYGLIDSQWSQLSGGKWHISDHELIWQADKASYEETEPPVRKLIISSAGKDCFGIKEDDSLEYALRRAK
jgi:hypothetical protein